MNGCLNILWHFPFFGFLFALFYALFGAILCCTVILYPVGLGFFQIARFLLTPFFVGAGHPQGTQPGAARRAQHGRRGLFDRHHDSLFPLRTDRRRRSAVRHDRGIPEHHRHPVRHRLVQGPARDLHARRQSVRSEGRGRRDRTHQGRRHRPALQGRNRRAGDAFGGASFHG